MAFKVGMLSKKATGGGGSDVTPDTIDWTDLYYSEITGEVPFTEKQITGINQTITLKVSVPANINFYYAVNAPINIDYDRYEYGDLEGRTSINGAAIFGLSQIYNNDTFTVNNNDWVVFALESGGISVLDTVTVTNVSDNDATLDTFTATVYTI